MRLCQLGLWVLGGGLWFAHRARLINDFAKIGYLLSGSRREVKATFDVPGSAPMTMGLLLFTTPLFTLSLASTFSSGC